MANPRTPVAKAKATGAAIKNPKRHADRAQPVTRALGDASIFLTGGAVKAWEAFKLELPWLMESDRAMIEICALVRGLMIDGEFPGTTMLSMYQSTLSKLGATPADRSKISHGETEPEADEFFGNN